MFAVRCIFAGPGGQGAEKTTEERGQRMQLGEQRPAIPE